MEKKENTDEQNKTSKQDINKKDKLNEGEKQKIDDNSILNDLKVKLKENEDRLLRSLAETWVIW